MSESIFLYPSHEPATVKSDPLTKQMINFKFHVIQASSYDLAAEFLFSIEVGGTNILAEGCL